MANKNLQSAKAAKNDEFYTQYQDIQKEINAYIEYNPDVFRGKIIYCNCDDPFESNFFMYFANKFKDYGLKKLIATSYVGSPIAQTKMHFPGFDESENEKIIPNRKNRKAFRIEINEAFDHTKDGITNLDDVKWLLEHDKNASSPLKDDGKYPAGDFRSAECIELLKQADIVATNPPFSLFREYVKQLTEYDKKFVIIGNINAITYKEIFPLIMENKMWLGNGFNAGNAYFSTPFAKEYADGVYNPETGLVKFRNVCWFTNLDHGRRHQFLSPQTTADNFKHTKHKQLKDKTTYEHYDNYDAIEVPFVDSIPGDYDGVMGVPISFLDKYNPDQFEIVGIAKRGAGDPALKSKVYTIKDAKNYSDLNAGPVLKTSDGLKNTYPRILIRKKEKK